MKFRNLIGSLAIVASLSGCAVPPERESIYVRDYFATLYKGKDWRLILETKGKAMVWDDYGGNRQVDKLTLLLEGHKHEFNFNQGLPTFFFF